MKVRSSGWLAWSLWAVTMAFWVAAVWLWLDNYARGGGYFAPQLLVVPGFATVGAIIVARRANTIGWLCVGLAFVSACHAVAMSYAVRDRLTGPATLPAGQLAGLLEGWLWPLNYLVFGLFLLLFPDGRLPTRRWRTVALSFVVLWSLTIVFNALDSFRGDLLQLPGQLRAAVQYVHPVVAAAAMIALPLTAAAPFLRFRQASREQREQLKWVAFAVVTSVACVVVGLGLSRFAPEERAQYFFGLVGVAGLVIGVPVAVGVAILRHGLYDIDRLIKRTLVYGLLTSVLGSVYATFVLVLGQLVGGLGAEPPSWAVAAATLAVAALFRPALGRIQTAVDRRFNRRTYDVAITVEAFANRLRDEIDFDTAADQLLAVVCQTMQPSNASMWLRPFLERQEKRRGSPRRGPSTGASPRRGERLPVEAEG